MYLLTTYRSTTCHITHTHLPYTPHLPLPAYTAPCTAWRQLRGILAFPVRHARVLRALRAYTTCSACYTSMAVLTARRVRAPQNAAQRRGCNDVLLYRLWFTPDRSWLVVVAITCGEHHNSLNVSWRSQRYSVEDAYGAVRRRKGGGWHPNTYLPTSRAFTSARLPSPCLAERLSLA